MYVGNVMITIHFSRQVFDQMPFVIPMIEIGPRREVGPKG
jgi:hypothetical protein